MLKLTFEWSVTEFGDDSCIAVGGTKVGLGCWVVLFLTSVWSASKRNSISSSSE